MDRGILDATRAAQSKAAGRLLDSAVIEQQDEFRIYFISHNTNQNVDERR